MPKQKKVNQKTVNRKLNKEPKAFGYTEDQSEYRYFLANALNYYTSEVQDPEIAKLFLAQYAKEKFGTEQEQAVQSVAAGQMVPTYGWLARIASIGSYLWENDQTRLDNYVQSFTKKEKTPKKTGTDETQEQKPNKEDLPIEKRMESAIKALTLVDNEIDRYLAVGKGQLNEKVLKGIRFSSKQELNYFKAELGKLYNEVFEGAYDEEGNLDRDAFNVKPTNVRKVAEFIEALQSQFVSSTKPEADSNPKSTKKKSTAAAVSGLRYLASTDDGLKSADPKKLIGASVVAVFDTEKKDLAIFEAASGGFTVTGTTIKNVASVKKKRVRKNYLSRLPSEATTCKKAEEFYRSIAGKGSDRYTTRMNSNKVILGVR